MVLLYATSGDYLAWAGAGSPPANIASLLRAASLLIAQETVAAYYDADPNTGAPTDTTIAKAFNDATCAQVAVWVGLGIDPALAGLDAAAPKRSKGIGTARVDYDTTINTSAAAFAARQAAVANLCVQAQQILRQAGVLSTRTWTYG